MKHSFPAQYIVDKKGQKRAVVISLIDYAELMEDVHDLKVIAERRKEGTIALEKAKTKLKK